MRVDYDPEIDKYNINIDMGSQGAFDLSFPEANQLHARLSQILTENMITMIAPLGLQQREWEQIQQQAHEEKYLT